MKRTVLTLALLTLAGCGGGSTDTGASVALPKGAALLFELNGKATNVFTCDGSQWLLDKKGEEQLFDNSGASIGSADSTIYSTTFKTSDGSLTAQVAAREEGSFAGDNPTMRYQVVNQQGSRFAAVKAVRRVSTRGVAPGIRECSQRGTERQMNYSAVYQFYSVSEQK